MEELIDSFEKIRAEDFNNNGIFGTYFCFTLGVKFSLRRGDFDSASLFLEKLRAQLVNFQDPFFENQFYLLEAEIMEEKLELNELLLFLENKLDHLKKLEYSNNFYYKFYYLYLRLLFHSSKHQKLQDEINSQYDTLDFLNNFQVKLQLLVLHAKSLVMQKSYKEAALLLKRSFIWVGRFNSELIAEYYLTWAFAENCMKEGPMEKEWAEKILKKIDLSLKYSKKIMSLKLIKQALLIKSLLYNKLQQADQREVNAKKILQIEYL